MCGLFHGDLCAILTWQKKLPLLRVCLCLYCRGLLALLKLPSLLCNSIIPSSFLICILIQHPFVFLSLSATIHWKVPPVGLAVHPSKGCILSMLPTRVQVNQFTVSQHKGTEVRRIQRLPFYSGSTICDQVTLVLVWLLFTFHLVLPACLRTAHVRKHAHKHSDLCLCA